MVNGGSGVLIQPARGEQSYILTAKHVLETYEGSGNYHDIDMITVTKIGGDTIDLARRLISAEYDLAILITNSKLDCDLKVAVSKPARNGNILYYGYPTVRRALEANEKMRSYPGQVTEVDDKKFTVTLDGRPGWGEVAGASGGGVFVEIEGELFLQGIESKFEGVVDREFHGRVICTPISAIEKFINDAQLEKIHPPSMTSFIGLVEKTFQCFAGAEDPDNLRFLINKLHERGATLGSADEISPYTISEKFKKKLLVKDCPEQSLYDDKLWTAYLEFLIISCLVDGVESADFSYIVESSTRRRFLFSTAEGNWIWRLIDIFRSDFRGLKVGGKIVVSTGDSAPKHEARSTSLEKVVIDIGRGQKNELVDSGIKNPALDFKVCHLTGLHMFFIVNRDEKFANYYAGSDQRGEPELMNLIKELYNAYI